MQVDRRSPDGTLARANAPHEYLGKYHFFFTDMTAQRFTWVRVPGLEAADTAFRGKSTWPVAGCVRSAILERTSHPTGGGWRIGLARGRLRRGGIRRTLDWTSTTDVGRKSDPSRRDHW
jgi:hypothetical protein